MAKLYLIQLLVKEISCIESTFQHVRFYAFNYGY